MELNTILKMVDYNFIYENFVPFKSEKNLDQLKHLYIEAQSELKFTPEVINAAVIYSLRVNTDNDLPTNNYIKKTLLSAFKFCKNADDATSVLLKRIEFENSLNDKKQSKTKYKNKVETKQDLNPNWTQRYWDELDNEQEL